MLERMKGKGNLFWSDKVYTDDDFSFISLKKRNDSMLTYSERIKQRYPDGDYVMNEFRILAPAKDTKVVDFGLLSDVMKSTNEEMLEANRWMFTGDCKFLDKEAQRTPVTEAN